MIDMSEKRFEYGETDLFKWVEVNGEMISTKECVSKLNKQQTEIDDLKEENRQLRNQLERKNILLKVRTKHIDDRVKSFDELLNYLESFSYKSNIDGNYAKQEIINILNNWEIKEERDCR